MDRQQLDSDPFCPHFGPCWALLENPGGSKIALFWVNSDEKNHFKLKFHQEGGFQTWVKYIHSESLTHTLHKSEIS